jgi:aminoglycoside phosphotransferase (APT) family kinase protein
VTDTEIEITADLVRDLLQEQHPDLAGLAIREVAGGWGSQMWRLGDELAVRMQRMDPTPELQLKERRWLPVLARACRSQYRPRCGSANRPSASPSTGP